jgi:hypothetical protein
MRPTPTSSPRAAWLAAALLVLAAGVSGCGDHTLSLFVDVLSFMTPAQTQTAIEPHVPPAPAPGLWISEDVAPPLVNDQSIRLFSGATNVVDVKSVTIRMAVEATDSSGAGADTLRLYMSGPNQTPRPGTPVAVVPLVFRAPAPGAVTVDSAAVTIDQPALVAQLFTGSTVRVTVTNAVQGPVGVPGVNPDLSGRLRIIQLDATVIAGKKPM